MGVQYLEQEGKGRAEKCKKASTSATTLDFLAGTELHV